MASTTSEPTPDDHFTAGPNRRVSLPSGRRVGGAGRNPNICVWIIAAAGIQIVTVVVAAPDDHLAAGPYCGVKSSCGWRVGGADSSPSLGSGIVFRAGVEIAEIKVEAAPDNHFAAGPHRRVIGSRRGRVDSASSSPRVVGAERNGDFWGIFPPQETGDARAQKASNYGAPTERPTLKPHHVPLRRCHMQETSSTQIAFLELGNKVTRVSPHDGGIAAVHEALRIYIGAEVSRIGYLT